MHFVDSRTRGISLRELLPGARLGGGRDIRVTSCSSRPEQVEADDLFVLLPDEDRTHEAQVHTAIARGAKAVLCERPSSIDVPTCVVSNAREAYGHLCQALAGNPSRRLRVVGVTGTNGKTTVAALVRSVLNAAGHPAALVGTPNQNTASPEAPIAYRTPSAVELAQGLAMAEAEGCSHAVVEVSSQALSEYRTAGIDFDAAVLTNVRRDHMDLHGSVLNYRKVKGRLLSQLAEQGFAVLNADDPASESYLNKINNPTLTVGQHRPAELTATVVERHRSEQTFLFEAGNETVPVRTRMVGDHHVTNCLLAAAVGLIYGVDLPTVVRGLEKVERVPGRLERIECGQPFSVFVDYARTPDTLAAGIRALRRITSGRVICVFGAEGEREKDQRPLLGRVVERAADMGIVTNNNPGHEQPLSIAHDILDGYERPGKAHILPNREKAILWALEQAKPGDSVLIAGKGDETGQRVGDEIHLCDDRQLVRNWLYEVGVKEPEYTLC